MTSTIAQNPEKIRIRLNLSYHGEKFHGWAAQQGLRTVEGELSLVLSRICRCTIALTVAGRTDAGVHASGQVAHFDLPKRNWENLKGRAAAASEQMLVRKANALLSHNAVGPKGYTDIVVRSAEVVSNDFDARFSALWRKYTYLIADGPRNWDPMRTDVLWIPSELDLALMNTAALPLLGEHDFLSFCKPRLGASTVRTLQELSFTREPAGLIRADVRADAFCHSQVRTLIGTLLEVGRGAREINWPAQRLAARNRNGEVVVAPAHGLTLAQIGYPPPSEYGLQALLTRRYRGAAADSVMRKNSVEIAQNDCGCGDF